MGRTTETKEVMQARIVRACVDQGIERTEQLAYVLATVEHETARTFEPVREAFHLSEEWRRANLRYFPYYGRGHVQLTWRRNYERFGDLLGLPLVEHPDLAMVPHVSRFILARGFRDGLFTGRGIGDYIDGARTDYIGARRCINGNDRASDIADLARRWESRVDGLAGMELPPEPAVVYFSNDEVPGARLLQEALRGVGGYTGRIDGKPGPMTNRAVIRATGSPLPGAPA